MSVGSPSHWDSWRRPDEGRFLHILKKNPDLHEELSSSPVTTESSPETVTGHSGTNHIPDEMLARWSQTLERTHGIKRRLLEGHLERCEECRGALEVLRAVSASVTAKPKPRTEADPLQRQSIHTPPAPTRTTVRLPAICPWMGMGSRRHCSTALGRTHPPVL